MKLWYGIEKEGRDLNEKTLFVCEKFLTRVDLVFISKIADSYGINRIYLGAGKKNVLRLYPQWYNILNSSNVVIETTLSTLRNIPRAELFSEVIIRNDVKEVSSNIVFKADDGKKVALYYARYTNSTLDVKNGMYEDDKIIEICTTK